MDIKGYQGYQGYKEQGINDMTPGELLMLLYDELVKRLLRAGLALDKKDYALFEASVDRSLDYFSYELNRVKAGRNKTELDRVKTMVGELRDSFREAQKTAMQEAVAAAAEARSAGGQV